MKLQLGAKPISSGAGGAERDDEAEDGALRRDSELLVPERRQHAALDADEAADQCIQPDEEPELRRVLA